MIKNALFDEFLLCWTIKILVNVFIAFLLVKIHKTNLKIQNKILSKLISNFQISRLLHKTRPGSIYASDFEKQLRDINAEWEATVRSTRQQYANFVAGRTKLQEIIYRFDFCHYHFKRHYYL